MQGSIISYFVRTNFHSHVKPVSYREQIRQAKAYCYFSVAATFSSLNFLILKKNKTKISPAFVIDEAIFFWISCY